VGRPADPECVTARDQLADQAGEALVVRPDRMAQNLDIFDFQLTDRGTRPVSCSRQHAALMLLWAVETYRPKDN
jgi:hypothetical protein